MLSENETSDDKIEYKQGSVSVRLKIEWRLKTLLGEDKIVGPLDPYVNKAVDLGKIDPDEGESLIRIGRFCDSVQLSANYCRAQSFDKMRSWSDIIGRIE